MRSCAASWRLNSASDSWDLQPSNCRHCGRLTRAFSRLSTLSAIERQYQAIATPSILFRPSHVSAGLQIYLEAHCLPQLRVYCQDGADFIRPQYRRVAGLRDAVVDSIESCLPDGGRDV